MERDLSLPHHVKALERFLDISRLLSEVENVMVDPIPTFKYSWNADDEDYVNTDSVLVNRDHKPEEKFIYDMSELTDDNMWLRDILLSDSSESSSDEEMNEDEMRRILKKHKQMKKIREKASQQSTSYSGYSTSILASDNPAFHFEFPSLDYSNKTRREKRPNGKKKRSKEVEPLTISEMIDALDTHCVSVGTPPPELLIESEGPCLKKPKYSRSNSQIWRDAIGQVVLKARERHNRIENLHCMQSRICGEIILKSDNLLSSLKHVEPPIKKPFIKSEGVESSTDQIESGVKDEVKVREDYTSMDVKLSSDIKQKTKEENETPKKETTGQLSTETRTPVSAASEIKTEKVEPNVESANIDETKPVISEVKKEDCGKVPRRLKSILDNSIKG